MRVGVPDIPREADEGTAQGPAVYSRGTVHPASAGAAARADRPLVCQSAGVNRRLRTLALYADAASRMRARQIAFRARRLVPLPLLSVGTAERPPAMWRGLAAGLDVDPAPQSGPQDPPHERGVFTFVGSSAPFRDAAEFWRASDTMLLFAFHLHAFAEMARYAQGQRTEEGEAFWERVTRSWLEHAGEPSEPGWHPYPLSGRILAWCAALSSGGWPSELQERMLRSLTRQSAVLRRCVEHDIGGNHVVRNASALICAGVCLGDRRSARRGSALLRREISSQILADGGHEERSTAYHRVVRGDIAHAATLLARATGSAPAWLSTACARMEVWEQAMRGPDGRLPLLNDAWEGPAEPSRRKRDAVTVLRESGYVVLRHAQDQLIADVGPVAPPHLPPHAHSDVLSFVLWADGRPLVVDPGSFAYNGPERAMFRGVASHNTVQVDGVDQCELWGDFRAAYMPRIVRLDIGRRGETVVVRARHDGYRRLSDPVEHERWFWWLPGAGVVVLDRLHATRAHQVVSRLHLAPGQTASTPHAIGPFTVQWLGGGATPAVRAGAYSPYIGSRVAIDVLERGAAPPPGVHFGYAVLRTPARAVLSGTRVTVTSPGRDDVFLELD